MTDTRSQLTALLNAKVTSGASDTTAQDVRDLGAAVIAAAVNLTDDKNVAGGYQSADLSNGKILVGNASNAAAEVTPSGDAVIGNTGVISARNLKGLFNSASSVGNSTTLETDLVVNSIAAGQLSADLDKLKFEYGGTFVSSGTSTRQIRLYFGGSLIFDTGKLTLSLSSAWTIDGTIIRVSSSAIRYKITFATEGTTLAAYTAVSELTGLTLANANGLRLTGEASGAGSATNDIVLMLSMVNYLKLA